MSDMPQRIWAQRSMDGKVWDEPADSLDLYTDYVRADKYADLERQRDELVSQITDAREFLSEWASHNPQIERMSSEETDQSKVICPACAYQFRAISMDDQEKLADLERQCESRYKGARCERELPHVHHWCEAFDEWSDEQADKPDIEPDMPEQLSGHEKDALQLALNASGKLVGKSVPTDDLILAKTGKSREWWRYHMAAEKFGYSGDAPEMIVKKVDTLMEELEK